MVNLIFEKKATYLQYIFVCLTTLLVIIIGVFNFTALFRKRKEIPFSNISPGYLMITFSGK